jgi:hypothetical protein
MIASGTASVSVTNALQLSVALTTTGRSLLLPLQPHITAVMTAAAKIEILFIFLYFYIIFFIRYYRVSENFMESPKSRVVVG